MGIFAPEVKIQGVYVLDVAALKQSVRSYELTNHLGNVLSTITDKGVITSAQDYFPFGLTLASRSFTEGGSSYRYSFNGMEHDRDLKQQDYKNRINRPDLGRFLSVDPIARQFPELTPYQFASNRPIDGVDLDGLEYLSVNHVNFTKGSNSGKAGFFSFLSGCNVKKENKLREEYDSKYKKISVAGQEYYDMGRHLYDNNGQFSDVGNRASQATEATKVGIQLVTNYDALPTDKPREDYELINHADGTERGIAKTQSDALLFQNCEGVCYAATNSRVNDAYFDALGTKPMDISFIRGSINPDHVISATGSSKGKFIGMGVGGALLRNNYGTEVQDVWDGSLQSGAVLQIWHKPLFSTPNNPYSGGGHSQIFRNYIYENNQIIGMDVMDNNNKSNSENKVFKGTTDTIRAVNLTDTRRQ